MSKMPKPKTKDKTASERPCRNCQPQVRLTKESLAKILADYLREHEEPVVDDAAYIARLAVCMKCTDLLDGCTCRHCGCLVQVRAKLAGKSCPSPAGAKW
jgi:hypothetical protein